MKIKIKSFNGGLPSYLTMGKWYKVSHIISFTVVRIKDDDGFNIEVRPSGCSYLKGGSWEVVNE